MNAYPRNHTCLLYIFPVFHPIPSFLLLLLLLLLLLFLPSFVLLTCASYRRHSHHRRAHKSDRAQKLEESSCAECGAKPPGKKRLNRCVGCSIVEYCSIACQKKAWKGHKVACRLTASNNAILIQPSARPDGMSNLDP